MGTSRGSVGILGEDVFHGVNQEPAVPLAGSNMLSPTSGSSISTIIRRIWRGRAELAEQRAFLSGEILQQVFVDVAFDIRAEFHKRDAVNLVHDFLEDVGVLDFEAGVLKVNGDLRFFAHERGHVGKHFVADEIAEVSRS
jgi:hypothetical protein